ncbi:hypothetical protein C8Q75DRAFT_894473 [Abortiporus biennis]|nr:hypothetical protein C8Q75DRAFT_894473 [Abortiporus biennis]
MKSVNVAVAGPARSGKSALVSNLDLRKFKFLSIVIQFALMQKMLVQTRRQLFFLNMIFTFDLTALKDSPATRDNAFLLYSSMKTVRPSLRACLVGTKWNSVPQNPYDVNLSLYGDDRSIFLRAPSLKVVPVDSVMGLGISELLSYIVDAAYPATITFSLTERLSQSIYVLQGWSLDTLASVLALPVPERVNQPLPDPCELDDDSVSQLVKSPEAHQWDQELAKFATGIFSSSTCHKITPTLVAKIPSPAEFATMEYIRAHTSIPIPQPRYPHLKMWLVMDRVDGSMLLECWESQSLWMKIRIACTLRCYVNQLRQLRALRPGNIVDGVIYDHELFDNHRCGPFASSTGFRLYCEQIAHSGWLSFVRYPRQTEGYKESEEPRYPVPEKPENWPLIFVHGDLNLGNIMLSKDGVLWIIDWATGGFFPPWLETVGIKHSKPPASFMKFVGFITGDYPVYEHLWDWFMTEAHRGFPEPRSFI